MGLTGSERALVMAELSLLSSVNWRAGLGRKADPQRVRPRTGFVKGFGCRPVRDGSDATVGPAFESLQGRKPRDDEALATLPMGISLGGEVLGEGLRCGSTVRRVR